MKKSLIRAFIFIFPVCLQVFIVALFLEQRSISFLFYSLLVVGLTIIISLAVESIYAKQRDLERMENLDRLRSEFISSVTHELKTPLTSIMGFTETLKEGALKDPEAAEHFLDIIDVEVTRLRELIDSLLEMGRVENAERDKDATVFEIREIVENCFELLTQKAQERDITLNFGCEAPIFVSANANKIKQVMLNLIDNAIKYNQRGGEVEVGASSDGVNLSVRVSDTGMGVKKSLLPRLFEPFFRVDRGRARETGGTGLGLSIVRTIVDSYGGAISVDSATEGPDRGTTFIVSLPIVWARTRDNSSFDE